MKLKAAVTKRKTILSCKRKVIDGKYILTTPQIHADLKEAEQKTKKGSRLRGKRDKRGASQVATEPEDSSEASEAESLEIIDCIEVRYLDN